MDLTKIADIQEPAIWTQYTKDYIPKKFTFIDSSCVGMPPPEVMSQMTAGGTIIDMPFWQESSHSEPKIMSDDETAVIATKKITADKSKARKMFWAEAWSQADLAGVFATGSAKDPLAQIADYIMNYWRNASQECVIAALNGVLADNVANDSSDMLYSVYSDTTTPAASNKMSYAAMNATRATLGDFMDDVTTIIVHPKVYTDMLNQEEITFVQPSNLPFKIPTFGGMEVIHNAACTTVAGTNATKYRSYLMGAGAIGFTMHMPEMAQEVDREPGQGNGGGVTKLYTRRHALVHPGGFKWNEASVAGRSPSFTELATATNWDRVTDRKNIKIAYLETN